jgi:hypothetical protein
MAINGSPLPCGVPVALKPLLWQAADRLKQVLGTGFYSFCFN